jgi:hypothetical protein
MAVPNQPITVMMGIKEKTRSRKIMWGGPEVCKISGTAMRQTKSIARKRRQNYFNLVTVTSHPSL